MSVRQRGRSGAVGLGLVMVGAAWLMSEALAPTSALPRAVAQPAGTKASSATANASSAAAKPRTPWTTSRLTGSPEPPLPYRTVPAFPKLNFDKPVELTSLPGTDWLMLLEQTGKLRAFKNDATASETHVSLDLADAIPGFRFAYGMTFDPHFAENRFCYISTVQKEGVPDGTRVSRFKVSRLDPPQLDPASERTIITWVSGGHNGAALQFGGDGMLYVSTGDAASPFPPDVHATGQRIDDLLASVLRIDVRNPEPGKGYRIPADNPFVGQTNARGEVWAYGFRNPWRMFFDHETQALWVGDVGWEMFEMIYRVEKGANYGWSITEGSQPVLGEKSRGPTPIVPPTVEHSHVESRSITGGCVYRGKRLPKLRDAYVYGDYVTGKMWALWHDGKKVTRQITLCDTPLAIVTFGLDREGELLIVDYAGSVHRLEANPPRATDQPFPQRLSETGLFASVARHEPAPGVLPYAIRAEAWNDGLVTEHRWMGLPGASRLGLHETENVQVGFLKGTWKFPVDGVLLKTVSLPSDSTGTAAPRRLETQILHYDGKAWNAYVYAWNDAQTDADLVPKEGATRTLRFAWGPAAGASGTNGDKGTAQVTDAAREHTWRVAARSECLMCHSSRAGTLAAFSPDQLARPFGRAAESPSQLDEWERLGVFEQPASVKKPAVDPHDRSASLEDRARSYLALNCGHCHRRGGGGTAAFELKLEFSTAKTGLIGARPTQGTFGLPGAQVVAAGEPARSVLLYRMAKLGRGRMPHFGSYVVDEPGVRLLREWIASLGDPAAAASRSKPTLPEPLRDRTATPAQATERITQTLATTADAFALWLSLDDPQLPGPMRDEIIRQGSRHADPTVRDLFESYIPKSQRQNQLALVLKPAELLALIGDKERGRKLVLETQGINCKSCHKHTSVGNEIGPELTQIGKRLTKADLLESLLEPSKKIEPKYQMYLVETAQGKVHQGLLVERTDKEVALKDTQNRVIRIPVADVEHIAPQRTSLMPELLLRDLQPQQIADLLEFLSQSR